MIERALAQALEQARGSEAPPILNQALRYAVFPGGARIRPRLCLVVARACEPEPPPLAAAAAAAIELLHCASLVHDDLPCFDDAAVRRGRPSVHRAYGERIAVLVGDALIVLALQTLACARPAARLSRTLGIIGRAVAGPCGIVAGQAWECESEIDLASYQRAKTGALFAAAAAAGACAAGADDAGWFTLGERLGEAYQIADDIRDVLGDSGDIGKPTGRDRVLGRPNAVHRLGLQSAIERLEVLVAASLDAVPDCIGAAELKTHIRAEAHRLLPRALARPAA